MSDIIPENIPQKQCTKCKQILPLTDFSRDRHSKSGWTYQCLNCRHPRKAKPVIPEGEKLCKRCNRCLPATPEYFHRDHKRPGGLYPTCTECIKSAYRASHPATEPPIPEGHKRCTTCRKDFPATTTYFHQNKAQDGSLNNECKTCKNERSKIYDQSPQVRSKRIALQRHRRDANKEYIRGWRQAHHEAINTYSRNRHARKKAASGTHTAQDIQDQYKRQRGRCYYCKKKLSKIRKEYHADHIVPLSRGGSNGPDNLVIACWQCNLSKKDRFLHEWLKGGRLL